MLLSAYFYLTDEIKTPVMKETLALTRLRTCNREAMVCNAFNATAVGAKRLALMMKT